MRMLVVGDQNQRSGTFYGASNLSGLPVINILGIFNFFAFELVLLRGRHRLLPLPRI